ncbi:MAG TPA: lipopolysaccharide biosynthesis protein [Arcobacter sp.]|nr:lipopolysaccharide biosynthesis protein [Arcobacter sp.]
MLKKLKPKSEFSRNVLTLMTGTTIAQAIPIAISPILTRIYTPEDFGVFALFIAITGLFSVVASGRYELALMLPKKEEDALNIFALGLVLILGLSSLLLLSILILHQYLVGILKNDAIGTWLYFIPLAVFFIGLFNLLSYYNNRMENYKDIAHATIVKSIILAVVQIVVGLMKSGAMGLISGQLASSFFANLRLLKNIVTTHNIWHIVSKIKMIALAKKYKDFPKFQAPHALLNTFSTYIPVYLFTPFFGLTVVGLYTLSTRIVLSPMMIIAGASAKVYNQKVTQLYNKKEDAYGFTVRFLRSLVEKILIPFVVIVVFSPDIFAFVFGEDWREAGVYTQILAPWLMLAVIGSTVSFIPNLINMQKKAFIVSIVLSIITLISLYIGVLVNNIYILLMLLSLSNSIIIIYNFSWMLRALKGDHIR